MGTHRCENCLRNFVRAYTLKRHRKSGVCPVGKMIKDEHHSDIDSVVYNSSENENNNSESDVNSNDEYDSDINDENDSDYHDDSENATSDENEDQEEEEDDDDDMFWNLIVKRVYNDLQNKFDETFNRINTRDPDISRKELEKKTFQKLKFRYSVGMREHYQKFLELMHVLRKDPIQKRVMETAKRLRDNEDYDYDESIKYAVKKRKYLIDKKLEEYRRPESTDNEEQ